MVWHFRVLSNLRRPYIRYHNTTHVHIINKYIHLRHIIMYWVLCIISCTFYIDPVKSPFNQCPWIPKFCDQNIMVLLWKTASSSSFLLSPARRFWAAWKPLPAWDGQTSDWWYLLGIEASKHRNSTGKNYDVTWCDEQEYTKMTGYGVSENGDTDKWLHVFLGKMLIHRWWIRSPIFRKQSAAPAHEIELFISRLARVCGRYIYSQLWYHYIHIYYILYG